MTSARHPSVLHIRPSRQMWGDVSVPGDKMIGQIGMLLAAMADGDSTITGYPWFGENVRLPQALQGLGVVIDISGTAPQFPPGAAAPKTPANTAVTQVKIRGCRRKLTPLCEPLDCGESGTALRLLTAMLAGQSFATRMQAGAHLSSVKLQPLLAVMGHMKADIRPLGAATE
ncbi:MAG TPA: hypothetical protein VK970_01870, partial [Candidatus Methylacidiphilales bacterium]|nr:hypothetical protein [Candidatus Methylacidiphilales bacterium]